MSFKIADKSESFHGKWQIWQHYTTLFRRQAFRLLSNFLENVKTTAIHLDSHWESFQQLAWIYQLQTSVKSLLDLAGESSKFFLYSLHWHFWTFLKSKNLRKVCHALEWQLILSEEIITFSTRVLIIDWFDISTEE